MPTAPVKPKPRPLTILEIDEALRQTAARIRSAKTTGDQLAAQADADTLLEQRYETALGLDPSVA